MPDFTWLSHALDMEIFDDERFWAWVGSRNDDPAKLRLAWHGHDRELRRCGERIGMPAISSESFIMKYHTTGSVPDYHFPEETVDGR